MSRPGRPVTERRVSCYGDWEVNVLCASLAWFLFYCRLHATSLFLRRCVKISYVERSATVAGFSEADDALFRRILYNETRVLHTYLPERPQILYSLRTTAHNKSLICKTSDLNERNFIVRCLYKDCY